MICKNMCITSIANDRFVQGSLEVWVGPALFADPELYAIFWANCYSQGRRMVLHSRYLSIPQFRTCAYCMLAHAVVYRMQSNLVLTMLLCDSKQAWTSSLQNIALHERMQVIAAQWPGFLAGSSSTCWTSMHWEQGMA